MKMLQKEVLTLTWKASTELAKSRVVKLMPSAVGQVAYAASTELPLGVTTDGVTQNEAVPVCLHGLVQVECGQTVTCGQLVSVLPDGSGKIQNRTVEDNYSIGVALESGTNGQLVSVLLHTQMLSGS